MKKSSLSLFLLSFLFIVVISCTPGPKISTKPIAPIVLSSSPAKGEEQALDAPIEITFDQPMDKGSVEKAFAIEPGASVDGVFKWINDSTVNFTLNNGFKRGERYKARIVESAKSAKGLAMQRPFELRFSAVGFLDVTNVQPADGSDEILADTIITVLFNRPVTPLNAIEDAASLPQPLTFVPPVTGQGEWLNSSIYRFTPDGDGFQPATEYTARIAKGLNSVLGNATLENDFEWSFTTVTPKAIASIPAEGNIYVSPTPVISITFNQPMSHASVEKSFSFYPATDENKPINGQFFWTDGGLKQPGGNNFDGYYNPSGGPEEVGVETVTFIPDKRLDFNSTYQVKLLAGVDGAIKGAKSVNDFIYNFTVTPYPAIEDTFPQNNADSIDSWRSFSISFNAPMNPDSLIIGKDIIIEPTVAVTQVYTYWGWNSTRVEINFPTEASSKYTVTVGSDIEGRYGQKLRKGTKVSWQTRALAPYLALHSPGRVAVYNAYTDTLAYVSVRNLSQVKFKLYHLPIDAFIQLNGDRWWQSWSSYQPAPQDLIAKWSLKTKLELNKPALYQVDLGKKSGLGDILPPDLYFLEASMPSDAAYPKTTFSKEQGPIIERLMLVVSKNNITFKSSNNEALAWVTNLKTGQPVKGVPISMKGASVSQATNLSNSITSKDGVFTTTYPLRTDPYETNFIFAGKPGGADENFAAVISNWDSGLERYQFNNVSSEDYQQSYNAHFYTDRKIYRPGQTVHFKGVIRNDDDAKYSLPNSSKPVSVLISDGQGKNIFNTTLTLSEMGTANGSFDLDEAAALGFYSIEIGYDGFLFYDNFQVAAYRKPEFLVEATTDKAEYKQGEKIKMTATAKFFFGGPVSNAKVRWTLLSDDYFFPYQGKGFYDFNDYDFSRSRYNNSSFGEMIANGADVTDKEGNFILEVDADIADKISSQRFTFDIVVTDLNNQETASQAVAVVHKGDFYIGLRPEQYVSQANEKSLMNLTVVDWDSQPIVKQDVELVFSEHNWNSVQRQYEDGSFYWESTVESVPVFTTTVTTDADGLATSVFTPTKGGVFRVSATSLDGTDNKLRSSTFMWVSGRNFVNWRQENNNRIEMVADKREYKVGDTATILVPHPYNGPVQALVTLERGHIYRHFVIELKTNSDQIKIPITEDMIPNMYLSVVVVNGMGENNGTPGLSLGYASLPINVAEKELKISMTPDKSGDERYQPGDTASYLIKVTDAQNQPVKAELSLALVDKAILSLAPETPGQMMGLFWRNRGLGIRTGAGLTLSMDRINSTIASEAKGGGGGGFVEGFGVARTDFKDTVLWVADLLTDKNGEGKVEAKLPDNLTTWTMTGKGVTGADTKIGEGTVDIISTKPLLVRPVTPRFFVVGDKARLGLIVQNNSPKPLEIETIFKAEGLTIEPVSDTNITVEADGRVKVEYNITVEDVTTATLTMGAKSADGELKDALTYELPIYRYSTPETVATTGIMKEDGTRQEGVALPRSFDPTQGDLTVKVDPSLAAGMRDGLTYLEHFQYECTEQTVSRFLPNIFTLRAYEQLNMENPELADRLPGLISVGLQRLYSQQHVDGGWGWWINDKSNPYLTAYVMLGLVEARRDGFYIGGNIFIDAMNFLNRNMTAPTDIIESWKANQQAFTLYVLAEAGTGDLGRIKALFDQREKLDLFGRAYLAMALHIVDSEASEIDTLINDITSEAIVSATGTHWEEAQADYFSMNTDTRSTAIIIAALSRIQLDNPILPNAVRWLMSIRKNGGHWETTQETAWAIIGLTDWMVATGELDGNYNWQVLLNGETLGNDTVNKENIDKTTTLQVEVSTLLADTVNRLAIERDPIGDAPSGSPGRLYYAAYLTYYKPVQEVKALDRGIIVSRQYRIANDDKAKPITSAKVGDVIEVKLTLIAPNDLHYVLVEDFFPAGAEAVDTSLATTSIVGEQPDMIRTDRNNPWGRGYGWWYFSHAELRDEKAVLFATYLPKGSYEYTYQIRASLPGEFNTLPTFAKEMYFPEVFGRGDGGLFKISQ